MIPVLIELRSGPGAQQFAFWYELSHMKRRAGARGFASLPALIGWLRADLAPLAREGRAFDLRLCADALAEVAGALAAVL